MYKKGISKIQVLHFYLVIIGLMFFIQMNSLSTPLYAQDQHDKEYVPIITGAKIGALPTAKVNSASFSIRTKSGQIPIEITPPGFWKSKKALIGTNYDLFEFDIEATSHTTEIGAPNVPIKVLEIDIPIESTFDKIVIESQLLKTVNEVRLIPIQEPLPVFDEKLILEKEKITLNKVIYEEENAYPGKFYKVIAVNFYGKRKVLIVQFFPVQYYPALKKVEFYRLKGNIKFKADKISTSKTKRKLLSNEEKKLGLSILNLKDAEKWSDYERKVGIELLHQFTKMDFYRRAKARKFPSIPCVIISADLFFCPAQKLASHHSKKGIKSLTVRVKNIQRKISGNDTPDKIRNFIKIVHKKFKTKWIILFGDVCKDPCSVTSVPTRMVVDPVPYSGVDDGWIPCDYYYSCLDGTWDSNNNGRYGEISDKPDLMPELCVGRIPTNNLDDAYKIVNSIIKYENHLLSKKGALIAANDLGWGCHEISFKEQTILPILKSCPYSKVHRLYQKWNNLTVSTFANIVNNGIDFIEYYGHGSPSSTQLMSISQVKNTLKSTPWMPVVFALSCSTSRYDYQECFGEAWIENLKASAYIGSTRVAYGSLSTGEGLDIRFIKNYCKLLKTGCALDYAKYQLFKDYGWDNYTIKTILEFTLLGDPVMLHKK